MIPVTVPLPPPSRGLADAARTWQGYQGQRENRRHMYAIDALLRRADANGWLSNIDEICFLSCAADELALQGLHNRITQPGCTFHGTVLHGPGGYLRSDASDAIADSYIDLGLLISSLGWTDTNAGFGLYCTTDFRYIYREFGRSATHLLSVNLSTGLAGYCALGSAGGIRFSSPSANGWFCFTRQDASNMVAIRDDNTEEILPAPFAGWPTATIDLLSAEPTGANSPNAIALAVLHRCNTVQCRQMSQDILQYAREARIYTETVERVLGANMFADSDLADIVPSNRRIYRHVGFPSAPGQAQSSYAYYPLTDSITGGHQPGGRTATIPAGNFTTANGSNLVTVNDTTGGGFIPRVGDLVSFIGATGSNGLAATDLNGRREIVAVTPITASSATYQVQASNVATASGPMSGAAATATYTLRLFAGSTYMPGRSGGFWFLFWVNRGKLYPGMAAYARSSGVGNGYGGGFTITRQTDILPSLKAGQQCRPAFSTVHRAITATEAQQARIMGYAANNEASDPRGQGYLDIVATGGSSSYKKTTHAAPSFGQPILVGGPSGVGRQLAVTITGATASKISLQRSLGENPSTWATVALWTGSIPETIYDDGLGTSPAAMSATTSDAPTALAITPPPPPLTFVDATKTAAQIQAAINAWTAGALVFAAGTYVIPTTLRLKNGIVLWADGVVTINGAPGAGTAGVFDGSSLTDWAICGKAPGQGFVFNSTLINATAAQRYIVSNCIFNNQASNGFDGSCVRQSSSAHGVIVNCDCNNAQGNNFGMFSPNYLNYDGNHHVACRQPLSWQSTTTHDHGLGMKVQRCVFTGTTRAAMEFGPSSTTGQFFDGLYICDNWFDAWNNPEAGTILAISLVGWYSQNTTVQRNYARRGMGPVAGLASPAIEITGSGIASDNIIVDFAWAGLTYGTGTNITRNEYYVTPGQPKFGGAYGWANNDQHGGVPNIYDNVALPAAPTVPPWPTRVDASTYYPWVTTPPPIEPPPTEPPPTEPPPTTPPPVVTFPPVGTNVLAWYRLGVESGNLAASETVTTTLRLLAGAIDSARCMTVGQAWMQADNLFNQYLGGTYAAALDLLIWYPVNISDATAQVKKGIMFDWEPYDSRPSADMQLPHALRMTEIAAAKAFKLCMSPNIFLPGQLRANALDGPNVLNTLINSPTWETVSILVQAGVGAYPDVSKLLDVQYAVLQGAQPVPNSKLMVTMSKGGGKWAMSDDSPLGPGQLSLAQCDQIATWCAAKSIQHVRLSNPMGGDIDKYHNNQEMHLLPNLAPGPPPSSGDPAAQVDAWITAKTGLGGAVPSAVVRQALVGLVSDLMVTTIWDRLAHLTWLGGDDSYASLVDLRQLLTGSFNGSSGTPTLTPLQSSHFDGADDCVITGYLAATYPGPITTTNMGLFWYATSDALNGFQAMAMARGGATNSQSLFTPCNSITTNNANIRLNSSGQINLTNMGTPTGLWFATRSANRLDMYKNGLPVSLNNDLSSFTFSTLLADRPLRLAANTTSVGADLSSEFRLCDACFAGVTGGDFSFADHQSLKSILDNFRVAVLG